MDGEISSETLEKIAMKITHMTFPEANDYLNSLPEKTFSAYNLYVTTNFFKRVRDLPPAERYGLDLEHP